jgi:hypothetical protein
MMKGNSLQEFMERSGKRMHSQPTPVGCSQGLGFDPNKQKSALYIQRHCLPQTCVPRNPC